MSHFWRTYSASMAIYVSTYAVYVSTYAVYVSTYVCWVSDYVVIAIVCLSHCECMSHSLRW